MKLIAVIALVILGIGHSHGFHVLLDTVAPDLLDFGKQMKSTMELWYPRIRELLWSPAFQEVEMIFLHFDPNYDGACAANEIHVTCNEQWVRDNKDVGTFIHEMTHHVQQHRQCEVWLTEGIADWISHYNYNSGQWEPPAKPEPGRNYTDGYATAAYFLKWIEDNKNKNIVVSLNAACRDGSYTKDLFKGLTKQDVNELWDEMMA